MIVSLRRFSFSRPLRARRIAKLAKVQSNPDRSVKKRSLLQDFEAMLSQHAAVVMRDTNEY